MTSRKGAGNDWAKMLEKETMDEVADSLFSSATVRKDEGLQARGTEQYLTRRIMSRKRKREDVDKEQDPSTKECERKVPSKGLTKPHESSSESEVSSGGLSENSKEFVRENAKKKKLQTKKMRADRRAAYEKRKQEEEDANDEPKAKKICKIDSESGEGNPKQNSKNEGELQPVTAASKVKLWKLNHLKKLEGRTDDGVVYYIVTRLKEYKKFLIENAMSIFGRETCIKMFLKTKKIEFYGGLQIKRNNRKRTEGGVFMYLLKNDKRIPEAKKAQFEQANTLCDEEAQKLKIEKANANAANKMDVMKNTVLERLNPTRKPASRGIWDLDGNNDYSVEMVSIPSNPRPNVSHNMPSRQVVDYGDLDAADPLLENSFILKTFDDSPF